MHGLYIRALLHACVAVAVRQGETFYIIAQGVVHVRVLAKGIDPDVVRHRSIAIYPSIHSWRYGRS